MRDLEDRKLHERFVWFFAFVVALALAAAGCTGEAGTGSVNRTNVAAAHDDARSPTAELSTPAATTPPATTSVPMTPRRGMDADLYAVDVKTGEATQLLLADGDQTDPERTASGQRVVYEALMSETAPQIFLLKANGTVRQLTHLKHGAQDPTWSPDGHRIAFASGGPGGDIFVMNADGTRIRRLAGTPKRDVAPDWSADGTRITFNTWCGTSLPCRSWPIHGAGRSFRAWSGIWVASFPGGALSRLTTEHDLAGSRGIRSRGTLEGDADAVWSPDGQWIAFIRPEDQKDYCDPEDCEPGLTGLWLTRPDGTDQHRLFQHFGHLETPSWSPDGRFIAFIDWHHQKAILVGRVATERVRILRTGAFIQDTSWDRDGIVGMVCTVRNACQ